MIRKFEGFCYSKGNEDDRCSNVMWTEEGVVCKLFGNTKLFKLESLFCCNKIYGKTYNGII